MIDRLSRLLAYDLSDAVKLRADVSALTAPKPMRPNRAMRRNAGQRGSLGHGRMATVKARP